MEKNLSACATLVSTSSVHANCKQARGTTRSAPPTPHLCVLTCTQSGRDLHLLAYAYTLLRLILQVVRQKSAHLSLSEYYPAAAIPMGSTVLQLVWGPTGTVAKVHPTVLFNIRRNDQTDRVIGNLLGSVSSDGTVDIRNSYAVPHNESLEQVSFQLDSTEDDYFEDVKRKLTSKLPLPQPLAAKPPFKCSVSNTSHVKKAVKVVSKRPTTSEPTKAEVLHAKKWGRPLKSVRSISQSDQGWNQFSGLSGCTWEERAHEFIRNKKLKESSAGVQQALKAPETLKASISPPKQNSLLAKNNPNRQLLSGLDLEQRCQPVVEYLISLGLDQGNLQKIAWKRRACFSVKISKVKERLEYLMSLGIRREDISKVLTRHPQVLEYTVDHMMKPRIQYLQSIGVPETRLGRIITVSPSLLECSLEGSLKRRVRFLVEEVGVREGDVWKVVLLSPQVLTQSIEDSLRPRMNFLKNKLGMSQERVAKMIMKHPQFLHYSIKNGIQPRIDFLRSIGLSDHDITVLLSRFSQVLSLSVEKSLKPKCDYLTKELNCGLQTIVSFPAYLSLSLEQRIQPRHKFLKSLNRLPSGGSFSMHILAVTDHEYCRRWAKSTVEEYHAFRQSLLLSSFAKKFVKRNRLQFDT